MRPAVTLPRTIPVRSFAVIASIPCFVAAPAYRCISWSLLPTATMPPLPVLSWNWPSASIASAHASSAWMPAIGACNSSIGFTSVWERSLSSHGTPSDKRTALACRERWTKEELGKRSSIERFFGRVFLFFRLQRPPYSAWSTTVRQVALTYTASIVVALAAWQAHRPDLIRSPKQVLAHLWEDSQ